MKFSDLRLCEPLLRALISEGYHTATPIQAQSIPHMLAGRDVLGCAQTGTGKTAAFALPILQRLIQTPRRRSSHGARALILCPTRELAAQIGDSFAAYGKHANQRHAVIFGGVGQGPQVAALRSGSDILIATPGRLLDLMNQGFVDLNAVEVLVLDEADRMMDMGFIHDIRRVAAKLPASRQSLLFSATMPTEIRRLADTILRNPVAVEVTPVASTVKTVEQSVYFVEKRNKPVLLAHLYNELSMSRVIVFTRTKHGADRVVRHLHNRGIRAEAIHGNKSQNARQRALSNFKASKTPVLVATDIASRGIDVDGISHVVNYDLSDEPETYVHRIGRTARAGASGVAVSFCDPEERSNLKAIERLIRKPIAVRDEHPTYAPREAADAHPHTRQQRPARNERHPQPHSHPHAHSTPHRRDGHAVSSPHAREQRSAGPRASQSARPNHPLQKSAHPRAGGAKPFRKGGRGVAPRRPW
jgi:ATP-dependent RNA helicase RhlE